MNTTLAPQLTTPSRPLLDSSFKYVPSYAQAERGILSLWRWERGPDNPKNYPDFQDTDQWVREEL